jgi:hypothetical protein
MDDGRDATPFARHIRTEKWHFHLDCSSYPAGLRVERQMVTPSSGVLCRECRRHAKRRARAD